MVIERTRSNHSLVTLAVNPCNQKIVMPFKTQYLLDTYQILVCVGSASVIQGCGKGERAHDERAVSAVIKPQLLCNKSRQHFAVVFANSSWTQSPHWGPAIVKR